LLVGGSLVLGAACTNSTPPAASTGATFVCVDDNLACDTDGDCCSTICDATAKTCTAASGCTEDDRACNDPADCCSQVCADDGYCGYPSSVVVVTCVDVGYACTGDGDCCSNNCGSGVCDTPDDGCTVDNDPCEKDSDCCSMVCAADGFCGLPG
jgi:hypothetical protein